MMIRILFFLFFAFSCQCWRLDHNHPNCLNEKLAELSAPINFNLKTRIYTLDYSKIAFPKDYKRIRDSFYNEFLLLDSNGIKHYHYIEQIQSLLKDSIRYTIDDFRCCFGHETFASEVYNRPVDLDYNFNSRHYKNCYNEDVEFGPYSTCSSLIFRFGKNGKLIKIFTEGFGY
ncbi:MAG: hypothetical protein ABIO44_04130 [Saprospiraceae bacterium]